MALLDDPRNKSRASLVALHDLLGFGELVASSGGTLDSAVGQIAFRRIQGLRRSIDEVADQFPDGSTFFHFNDMLMAHLAVSLEVTPSGIDPGEIGVTPPSRDEYLRLLRFLSAAAALHQRSIANEEEERLGPAGRTFVVLGKRWDLESESSSRVVEVPPLQANLAFAEAYLADKAGSAAGFCHRSRSRLYINDHLQSILIQAELLLHADELKRLQALGEKGLTFPANLQTAGTSAIRLSVFHRDRYYHSLVSNRTANIAAALQLEGAASGPTRA